MLLLLLFRNSTASCDDMCNSVNWEGRGISPSRWASG
jgi:hypothetical protein